MGVMLRKTIQKDQQMPVVKVPLLQAIPHRQRAIKNPVRKISPTGTPIAPMKSGT
jgi:hypothetical protein